jgi:hypothetical protein
VVVSQDGMIDLVPPMVSARKGESPRRRSSRRTRATRRADKGAS